MIADERAGRPNQTMIADERAEDSRACTRKCTRIHPHSEWSFFFGFLRENHFFVKCCSRSSRRDDAAGCQRPVVAR